MKLKSICTKQVRVIAALFVAGMSTSNCPARADIIGGDEVEPQDPVQHSTVALFEPSADGRGGALCTASILSKDTAVTAAHCIDRNGRKPVMIFGTDVRSPETSKRQVTATTVHPGWESHHGKGMGQGDIAVVKFKGGLPAGYQPVSISTSETDLRRGQVAVLAGYGISDARRKSGAGVLRKTSVAIENPRPGQTEMILDQSHGRGACHGDSGGPAFVRVGGKSVLAGITNRSYPASAPDDCGNRVVYTKVSAYQPWIQRTEADLHSKPGSRARDTLRSIQRKAAYRIKGKARAHATRSDATHETSTGRLRRRPNHFRHPTKRTYGAHLTKPGHKKTRGKRTDSRLSVPKLSHAL